MGIRRSEVVDIISKDGTRDKDILTETMVPDIITTLIAQEAAEEQEPGGQHRLNREEPVVKQMREIAGHVDDQR
jgi:hypothetical protein